MSEIDRRGFSTALAAGFSLAWPSFARAGEGGGASRARRVRGVGSGD